MQFTFAAATAAESGALVVGATEGPELLPAAAKADRATTSARAWSSRQARIGWPTPPGARDNWPWRWQARIAASIT